MLATCKGMMMSQTSVMFKEKSESLLMQYQEFLADADRFSRALHKHDDNSLAEDCVSIQGLLALFDMVVDMLSECGLRNLKSVYVAIKKHTSVHFEQCNTWQTCHLSGVNARGCIKLGDSVFVQRQHAKWVLCLWLCLHMKDQERGRSSVPDSDANVYRSAMQCVLEQLHGAYSHVANHFKKNNLLAWAPLAPPPTNDDPC